MAEMTLQWDTKRKLEEEISIKYYPSLNLTDTDIKSSFSKTRVFKLTLRRVVYYLMNQNGEASYKEVEAIHGKYPNRKSVQCYRTMYRRGVL